MLSIDEAIAHARAVAETCECEASRYDMCDSYEREVAYKEGKCAEEHEQLAEWLTELKAYREIGTVEECRNSILDILKAYNKAIDDYVNNCSEYYFNVDDSQSSPYLRNINIISQPNIERIAEQLKKKI